MKHFKTVETINFYFELDLLEAHLDEHQHFIDKIVVAESIATYSGMPKPLYFADNMERYRKYNVVHEVIPIELFIPIPESYPEEERKKWFDARRVNRERQVGFLFDKYKKNSDYVCTTDVDEIWSRNMWPNILESMEKEFRFIIPKVQNFFYFADILGRIQKHYRISRSDMPGHVRIKGVPRGYTEEVVGWHFTSCCKDPEYMRLKGIGLAQSLGYLGWKNSLSTEQCKALLDSGYLPFLNNHPIAPSMVMPIDDLSWLPEYFQQYPDQLAWLDKKYREGVSVSNWKLKY